MVLIACTGKGETSIETGPSFETGPVDSAAESEPVELSPVAPQVGERSTEPLDCTGRYTLPPEWDEGLAQHGWTSEDLVFPLRWSFDTRFEMQWISDNADSAPSMRVRPWLVPEASTCYEEEVSVALGSQRPLSEALAAASAFAHPETAYDALERDRYSPPDYGLSGEEALYRALLGLHQAENPLGGAPSAGSVDEEALRAAASAWPVPAGEALARLVLAVGEAGALKAEAVQDADSEALERIHAQFLDDWYGGLDNAFVSPYLGTVVEDLREHADSVDSRAMNAAAQAVAVASDDALAALAEVEPFEGGEISLQTAWGEVLLRSDEVADRWEDPHEAALIVDLGGDDEWTGRYASTTHTWMGASVVLDVRGSDVHGADTPDVTSEQISSFDAFHVDHGFSQGSGLLGVGLLADGAGDDRYAASVYAQGSAALGVGMLYDGGGMDDYQLGNHGQGAAFFGLALLLDVEGDDRYGVYTMGQGAGKPGGHGLLLDLHGDDTYIGYYNAMEPYLPEPGYPNHYALDESWSYSESDGTPHYMSVAQGVGWGYRGDWFSDLVNWGGGFGALVDLGEGDDVHYADDMSMGQGFVYGMGLLVDGGGDDTYRMFWWGMGAAAHMGVGVLLEEGGDDDLQSAWASAGFGYDCSIGWTLDHGGNDRYGGKWYAGYSYTYGMSFFLNSGGDDVYNYDEAHSSPEYGVVNWGFPGQKLAGVFLELGGGSDTYHTDVEGIGNDAEWYLEPTGTDADPDLHKGIGIDR